MDIPLPGEFDIPLPPSSPEYVSSNGNLSTNKESETSHFNETKQICLSKEISASGDIGLPNCSQDSVIMLADSKPLEDFSLSVNSIAMPNTAIPPPPDLFSLPPPLSLVASCLKPPPPPSLYSCNIHQPPPSVVGNSSHQLVDNDDRYSPTNALLDDPVEIEELPLPSIPTSDNSSFVNITDKNTIVNTNVESISESPLTHNIQEPKQIVKSSEILGSIDQNMFDDTLLSNVELPSVQPKQSIVKKLAPVLGKDQAKRRLMAFSASKITRASLTNTKSPLVTSISTDAVSTISGTNSIQTTNTSSIKNSIGNESSDITEPKYRQKRKEKSPLLIEQIMREEERLKEKLNLGPSAILSGDATHLLSIVDSSDKNNLHIDTTSDSNSLSATVASLASALHASERKRLHSRSRSRHADTRNRSRSYSRKRHSHSDRRSPHSRRHSSPHSSKKHSSTHQRPSKLPLTWTQYKQDNYRLGDIRAIRQELLRNKRSARHKRLLSKRHSRRSYSGESGSSDKSDNEMLETAENVLLKPDYEHRLINYVSVSGRGKALEIPSEMIRLTQTHPEIRYSETPRTFTRIKSRRELLESLGDVDRVQFLNHWWKSLESSERNPPVSSCHLSHDRQCEGHIKCRPWCHNDWISLSDNYNYVSSVANISSLDQAISSNRSKADIVKSSQEESTETQISTSITSPRISDTHNQNESFTVCISNDSQIDTKQFIENSMSMSNTTALSTQVSPKHDVRMISIKHEHNTSGRKYRIRQNSDHKEDDHYDKKRGTMKTEKSHRNDKHHFDKYRHERRSHNHNVSHNETSNYIEMPIDTKSDKNRHFSYIPNDSEQEIIKVRHETHSKRSKNRKKDKINRSFDHEQDSRSIDESCKNSHKARIKASDRSITSHDETLSDNYVTTKFKRNTKKNKRKIKEKHIKNSSSKSKKNSKVDSDSSQTDDNHSILLRKKKIKKSKKIELSSSSTDASDSSSSLDVKPIKKKHKNKNKHKSKNKERNKSVDNINSDKKKRYRRRQGDYTSSDEDNCYEQHSLNKRTKHTRVS